MIVHLTIEALAPHTHLERLEIPIPGGSSKYRVASIGGLEPVEVDLVSSPFASSVGEFYHANRIGKRTMPIHLELNPFYSGGIASIRRQLNYLFDPAVSLKMTIRLSSGETRSLMVHVEDIEYEIWSEDLSYIVTLVSFDPRMQGVVKNFETYHSVTADQKTFAYEGTTRSGLTISLRPSTNTTNTYQSFTVALHGPIGLNDNDSLFTWSRSQQINFSGTNIKLENNTSAGIAETFRIRTTTNEKSFGKFDTLSGVFTSMLEIIDYTRPVNWFELDHGKYRLRIYGNYTTTAVGGGAAINATYANISYTELHGGL